MKLAAVQFKPGKGDAAAALESLALIVVGKVVSLARVAQPAQRAAA